MIRDRGRIKWTSMMLPEHVKQLRDWAKEDEWERKRELDEQKLEEIDEIAQIAIEENEQVSIQYYIGKNYEFVKGRIRTVDPILRVIKVVDLSGNVQSIELNSITDIQLVDEDR